MRLKIHRSLVLSVGRYIAEKHELVDTLPFIQDFVRANFISIVGTHSFLGLSVDQITRLLTDDGLKVGNDWMALTFPVSKEGFRLLKPN